MPIGSRVRVLIGEPIDVPSLEGRITLSSYDDIYTAHADGTGLERVTSKRGPEFDASWEPDGRRLVYRDSRRGINENDEIYVVDADGSNTRNLTNDPGNDWGPDWSPDGRTIVFNSDRDGSPMGEYLVDPDGSPTFVASRPTRGSNTPPGRPTATASRSWAATAHPSTTSGS